LKEIYFANEVEPQKDDGLFRFGDNGKIFEAR